MVEQVQANRQTALDACGFKLGDRRQHRGGVGGAGRGWLEALGRFRHAPSADAARRTLQRVGGRAGDTLKRQRRLTDENLQTSRSRLRSPSPIRSK